MFLLLLNNKSVGTNNLNIDKYRWTSIILCLFCSHIIYVHTQYEIKHYDHTFIYTTPPRNSEILVLFYGRLPHSH